MKSSQTCVLHIFIYSDYEWMSGFVAHADKNYKCDRVYNCPYIGQKLVRKVMMGRDGEWREEQTQDQ